MDGTLHRCNNLHRCRYEKLPTDKFDTNMFLEGGKGGLAAFTGALGVFNVLTDGQGVRVTNSMEIPPPYDATVNERWDSGGICGCCANGRGCKGFGMLCYACVCMHSAQVTLSTTVSEIKGLKDVNGGTFQVLSGKNAMPSTTSRYALELQQNFLQKESAFCLPIYSRLLAPCLLTYAWFTAERLKNKHDKFKDLWRGMTGEQKKAWLDENKKTNIEF
jgi:hypothetical protein